MTPQHVATIQSTADAFLSVSDRVVDVFYDRLFELSPETRELFPEDLSAQKRKLVDTLGTLLTHLLHHDILVAHLRRLGERHAGYGVRAEHYGPTGAALIHALRISLGSRFTPEAEEAWTALYGEIAKAMSTA